MAVRKKDPSLQGRQRKNFLMLGGPFAILVLLGVFFCRTLTSWFLVFVAAAAVGLTGFLREVKLFRRYRCPQCGARLPECPRQDGQPIEFFCQDCDVIWDSGFIESEVSGG
jgi:hypothetical protein